MTAKPVKERLEQIAADEDEDPETREWATDLLQGTATPGEQFSAQLRREASTRPALRGRRSVFPRKGDGRS